MNGLLKKLCNVQYANLGCSNLDNLKLKIQEQTVTIWSQYIDVGCVDIKRLGDFLLTPLSQFLVKRGFKEKNNKDTWKKIQDFEKTTYSTDIWTFLNRHPSNRALINSIVKMGESLIDPYEVLEKTKSLFESSKTSAVYAAKCSCGAFLDRRYVFQNGFKFPRKRQLLCPNCSVSHKINKEDYFPLDRITYNDLIKVFDEATTYRIFGTLLISQCIYCDSDIEGVDDLEHVNLICNQCGNIRSLNRKFVLIDPLKFFSDKQGYWFEWYVWKQLKNRGAFHSKLFTEKASGFAFDVDVCLMDDDGLIIFECKDTRDVQDTLANLHLINKIASQFFLVSTQDINKKQIAQMESTLGQKFHYIPPPFVDNVISYIK